MDCDSRPRACPARRRPARSNSRARRQACPRGSIARAAPFLEAAPLATTRLTPKGFLRLPRAPRPRRRTAVSLFSGAGLSDLGYELAGFKFHVQVERDARRAAIGQKNFPDSTWIVADVGAAARRIAATYRRSTQRPLDLLVATPPCQGLSSSNPSRGKRRGGSAEAYAEKNQLILAVPAIARALKPKLIVVENVRQILTLPTSSDAEERVVDAFQRELPGYHVFEGVVNVADYGLAQDRRRAVVVAIRTNQPVLRRLKKLGLVPWPSPTHGQDRAPWVPVRTWLEGVGYQRLEASSERAARGSHALHRVPAYDADRFALVADIPPYSGLSAYHNDRCRRCGHEPVPSGRASCSKCGAAMLNRPVVVKKVRARLIRGFHSSYRRMAADRPAPTVTTNSSHIGSDFKIHPWEHRVLSALECSDLQTVPRFYDWSPALVDGQQYLVRNVIGEAFPPYFTYLHGLILRLILSGGLPPESGRILAEARPGSSARSQPALAARA